MWWQRCGIAHISPTLVEREHLVHSCLSSGQPIVQLCFSNEVSVIHLLFTNCRHKSVRHAPGVTHGLAGGGVGHVGGVGGLKRMTPP